MEEKVVERESAWSWGPHNSVFTSLSTISIVCLLLIYGSSLLISQVTVFYKNSHGMKEFDSLSNRLFPQKHTSIEGKVPLTFKSVRAGTFKPETKEIQWLETSVSKTNDTGDFVVTKGSKYFLKNVQDPEFSKLLYDGSEIVYDDKKYKIEDVVFSNDLKHVLLVCDKIHNWRHSFFAPYFIYNIETKTTQSLYDKNNELNEKIALAKWSPDSKKIAFVLENNVYIKNISDFIHPTLTQVTHDGGKEIFYGKPDWVYEEEVFESDTALWWSPNSEFLSMLRCNDTQVPTYPIPYFVQDDEKYKNSSYPELREIKYPKAGYPNPVVDFLVYDMSAEEVKYIDQDDDFYHDKDIPNDTRLITEMVWVGDQQVLVKTTNRVSDILKIFIVDVTGSKLNSTLTRSEDLRKKNSWFEIEHNTLYIPKAETRPEEGYIDVLEVDGYDHLAYFSPPTAATPKAYLTRGDWEVVGGPRAFDYITNKVYFISTEKSSMERHLYSVGLDGKDKTNVTDVSKEGVYSASFSKGSRYLLLNYNGPDVPYQNLIDLHTMKVDSFETNEKLKGVLEKYIVPKVIYGELNLGDGVKANYKQTFPLNFNPSHKYPLLFFVYGGPGSQLVVKTFGQPFSSVIASELDAVVVTVDGRGTGFKGKQFRNVVKNNLSHYEVIDQIAAGNIFISKPYIDPERTAIWGWSYGGFMTLKTLEKDQGNVFKYGMAVAPVTNWMFYDSIYTERYMNTPQNNPNYKNGSVHDVEGFKSVKRFLLMHGTGDDNVHLQNSLKFLDMLDQAGVENYDVHVFPDSDHSISYHNANTIVYDKLFIWLKLAFAGVYDEIYEPVRIDNYGPIDPDLHVL
ncbi:hypothetical protein HII13_000839 [Brettanomyces bruxellensis]|nr:hypothetical protein HII13_000839 [Brettanomyces bruxellensis]